jgi:hypothetical protein
MIHRAFKVVSPKGDAVFLAYDRALEYATKHRGVVVKLFGKSDGEAPDNGNNSRQTGEDVVTGSESISQEPPNTGEMGAFCG